MIMVSTCTVRVSIIVCVVIMIITRVITGIMVVGMPMIMVSIVVIMMCIMQSVCLSMVHGYHRTYDCDYDHCCSWRAPSYTGFVHHAHPVWSKWLWSLRVIQAWLVLATVGFHPIWKCASCKPIISRPSINCFNCFKSAKTSPQCSTADCVASPSECAVVYAQPYCRNTA